MAALAHWRPSIPEAVLLGKEHFGYSPGRAPAPQHFFGYHASLTKAVNHLCAPVTRIVIPKSELAKFELERIGERQRLSFLHGLEQVEIGASLSKAEREWLFLLLEQWRTQPRAADEQEEETIDNRPTRKPSELIGEMNQSIRVSRSVFVDAAASVTITVVTSRRDPRLRFCHWVGLGQVAFESLETLDDLLMARVAGTVRADADVQGLFVSVNDAAPGAAALHGSVLAWG